MLFSILVYIFLGYSGNSMINTQKSPLNIKISTNYKLKNTYII